MSIAKDLATPPAKPTYMTCRMAILLYQMDSNDQVAVREAITKIRTKGRYDRSAGTSPYTATWLINVLARNGMTISRNSMRKHLNKECNCVDN
jgi:hypothetical protein